MSSTLRASDYGGPPFPFETFQNANPPGWSGGAANNNNSDPNAPWALTNNGRFYNGVKYTSPGSNKLMIVTGNGGGSVSNLITPPFSLVGLINPVFEFKTAANFNFGTTGKVEISTNGGT